MDRSDDNNLAKIAGIVKNEPKFSHNVYGEKFFIFEISVKRNSEYYDKINVILPERLCPVKNVCIEDNYMIFGQFRSHNNPNNNGNRLLLNLFAKNAELLIEKEPVFENNIKLQGYICKPITYRKTPLGREISDILIAVNRAFGKSDYIPCIAWGRNAKYASLLGVGTKVFIEGRIQSREYIKNTGEDEMTKTAYEISVSRIEILDD